MSFSEDSQDIYQQALPYDLAITHAGSFGRFQVWIFLIGGVFSISAAVCNLSYLFIAASPLHWCHVADLDHLNLTLDQIKQISLPLNEVHEKNKYSDCEMYDRDYGKLTDESVLQLLNSSTTAPVVGCTHWSYDRSQYHSTITTQWDLVCSHKALPAISQSIFMAGLMVGSLLFGALADGIGRRRTQMICVVVNVVSSILMAFSVNFIMFSILRFLVAATCVVGGTTFVLMMEVVGPSYRVLMGCSFMYFWVAGYLLLAGFGYVIRDWQNLQMAIAFPLLIYLVFFCFFEESPRWLYSKGRTDEADRLMRKIAKINKKEYPEKIEVIVSHGTKPVYIWDVCRYPVLRLRVVIVYFIWFVCSLVYFGLSLDATGMEGNSYINFVLLGAVELPAYVFCHIGLDRIGRQYSAAGSMLLGGASLLLTIAVPSSIGYQWLSIGLTIVGKFSISAAFAIMYVYTTELFPTVVRNSGLGSASCIARVGGIVAPQMALLNDYYRYTAILIFGSLSLVAGLATFVLPETAKSILPETLEQGDRVRRNKNPSLDENESDERSNKSMLESELAPL